MNLSILREAPCVWLFDNATVSREFAAYELALPRNSWEVQKMSIVRTFRICMEFVLVPDAAKEL